MNCIDAEGAYPSPFYGLLFSHKEKWIELAVSDLGVNLEPGTTMCSKQDADYPYLQRIRPPNKIGDKKYKVYDDFMTLIRETLIIK